MYCRTLLILVSFTVVDLTSATCANSLWTYYEGACYYFMTGKASYDEAKASCAVMGPDANLVSIHSDAEQEFLNTKYGSVKYWLGLEPSSGLWKWNDNTLYVYSNWFSTSYATASTSACPMVNYVGNTGKWFTLDCSKRDLADQGTLCKYYVATVSDTVTTTIKASTPSTGAVGLTGVCVNSLWTYYNGACYYFATGKVTYDDAKASCALMAPNSHLVSVHSDAEQQFLNDKYGSVKYFLGLVPYTTSFTWEDATAYDYSNWLSASSASPAQCSMVNYLGSAGKWYSVPCATKDLVNQGTLCKYDLSTDPATTLPTTTTSPTTTTTTSKYICEDQQPSNFGQGQKNCGNLQSFCNDPNYYDLMTAICPVTCGRCRACADKMDDNGVNRCPDLAHLCDESVYYDIMTVTCPVTCDRCPEDACVDEEKDTLGNSACGPLQVLCSDPDPAVQEYLTEACKLTCNLCPV